MKLGLGIGISRNGTRGTNPQDGIDAIIAAAGSSLYQFNDAYTYDESTGAWPDSSNNSRSFSSASGQRPTVGTFKGRKSLVFDGTNDYMTGDAPAADYLPLYDHTNTYTVFMVANAEDNGVGNGALLLAGSAGGNGGLRVVQEASSDEYQIAFYNSAGTPAPFFNVPQPPLTQTDGMLQIDKDATDTLCQVRGGGISSQGNALFTSGPPSTADATIQLGGQGAAGTLPLKGEIVALIILQNPTEAQKTGVANVLRGNYLQEGTIAQLSPAAWYSADTDVTVASAAVSAWGDRSGWGNHASQATESKRPDYIASGINGLPSVATDPVTVDRLVTDNLAQGVLDGNIDIFVVGEVSTSINNQMILGDDDNYPGFYQAAGKWAASAGSQQVSDIDITLTKKSIFNTTLKGASGADFLVFDENGTRTDTTSSSIGTSTLAKISLGGSNITATSFDGIYAEVIVFDYILSDADRTTVLNYLKAKYDIVAADVPPSGGAVTAMEEYPTPGSPTGVYFGGTPGTYQLTQGTHFVSDGSGTGLVIEVTVDSNGSGMFSSVIDGGEGHEVGDQITGTGTQPWGGSELLAYTYDVTTVAALWNDDLAWNDDDIWED